MKTQVSNSPSTSSASFDNFREKTKPKTSSFKPRLSSCGKICKLGDFKRQKREQRRVLAQLYDLVPTVPEDHSADLLSSSSRVASTPEDDLSEICKLELLQRVLDYMSDLRQKLTSTENDENQMIIAGEPNDCSILTKFCTVHD